MKAKGASQAESVDAAGARKLGRAFFALAALTYGLIVLGALVRAHGAGLACPDWPLCGRHERSPRLRGPGRVSPLSPQVRPEPG